jgi:transmembrane sensor
MSKDTIARRVIEGARELRREEATRWFVALQHAELLSARMLKSWKQWESIPENRAAFDAVERAWRLADALPPAPEPTPQERATDHYDGSTSVLSWQFMHVTRAPRHRLLAGALGLAAAIVAAVVGLQWLVPEYVGAGSSAGHLYVATDVAEHKELLLEDGTRIHLGAQTLVTTSFTEYARTVVLHRGEALFEVAKDRRRPFWVETDRAIARAVGTAFAVSRVDPDRTVVTVKEGVVAVARKTDRTLVTGSGSVTLRAGEQVGISEALPLAVVKVDLQKALAWVEGWLQFDVETVAEAAHEFNLRNQVKIKILNPAVGQRPVRGTFEAAHPAAFAAYLQRRRVASVVNDTHGSLLLEPYREEK